MNKHNLLKYGIMTGLWAVLLIPFFVANSMFFPYITGKNFAFRIIVEIIFALWVYLAVIDANYRPKFSWISVSIAVFVAIMAIADFFAVNPVKAMWSNFERMDGFITLAHLLMYFIVFGSVMKTEKNWMWFFRSSLIASMIMAIVVYREWLNTGVDRVSATLGNPIYVAVYFMFNFFFAGILWYKDVIAKTENDVRPLKSLFSNWLTYVYLVALYICAFGIWRTSTRGVILGLLGGLVITSLIMAVFEKKNKILKNSAIGCLVIIVAMVLGFMSIKNTQFVQNNVTLKRLADISWTQVAGQGQARQYVWPMALKGFEERPWFGWGQDGFNNIFNKNYDVRMYSQEQWFDRAHNMPLDVLVAGGVLGLIAYFSIFVAAIYVVTKKKDHFSVTEAGLIVGLLAAYFAQNLFVFDNLVSYFMFYAILAYLYSKDTHGVSEDKRVVNEDVANYVIAPILVLIFIAIIWYCNVRPINANKDLIIAMQSLNQSPEKSLEYFKKVFDANTFGSPEAREQIVSITPSIAAAPALPDKVKQGFVELAYSEMQKQINETPNDARYQFFMGVFLDNMNQFQNALPYLEKAVELSPNKLTMMFELAKCYSYLGQKEKALEIAKKAYDFVPEFDAAKMSYAAALILNDQELLAKQIIGTAPVTNEIVIRMYLIKASAFIQKGDKLKAVAEIEKSVDLVPGFKTQGETIIKGIWEGTLK